MRQSLRMVRDMSCLQGLQVGGEIVLDSGAFLLSKFGLAPDGPVKACQALLADVCCLQWPCQSVT